MTKLQIRVRQVDQVETVNAKQGFGINGISPGD